MQWGVWLMPPPYGGYLHQRCWNRSEHNRGCGCRRSGVWLMPPPHGGYLHQTYGPLHGRYLHGLMADGTSCERFVPDSCYIIPGTADFWLTKRPLSVLHGWYLHGLRCLLQKLKLQ